MTSLMVLILAAGAFAGADTPKEDSVKQELKRLEGTWAVVALEVQGQKLPEDQLKKEQPLYVFKGEECTVKSGNKTISRAVIKIDPRKMPKTIDATGTDGTDKDQTIMGIYEMEGDNLKICYAVSGKPRPTDFLARDFNMIMSLKRQKP